MRYLAILALLAVAASGQATLDVPASFATIQAALNAAAPGDTVLVQPGVYVENVDYLGKDVALRSAGGSAVTTIDGNAADPVVRFWGGETRAAVLAGFTILNGQGTSSAPPMPTPSAGGIDCAFSSPTIVDCVITGNVGGYGATHAGTAAPGGLRCYEGAPAIDRCLFHGNVGGYSGLAGPGAGAVAFDQTAATIRNSVIAGNTGGQFAAPAPEIAGFSFNGGPGGMMVAFSPLATVVQCTIADNVATPPVEMSLLPTAGGLYNRFGAGASVFGSVIYGNTPVGTPSSPEVSALNSPLTTPIVVNFSDVFQGYAGLGNIDADPGFVDPATLDYRLGATSPCRDTSCGLLLNGTTDFDGDARVVGLRPDIGADEIVGTAPLLPGTGEDLQLLSVVNGGGDPFLGQKTLAVGDVVAAALASPCTTFATAQAVLSAQFWFTPFAPQPVTGFPELWLDTAGFLVIGPTVLGSGLTHVFTVPVAALTGYVIRFQGAAIFTGTKNGLFAASDAHDFVLP